MAASAASSSSFSLSFSLSLSLFFLLLFVVVVSVFFCWGGGQNDCRRGKPPYFGLKVAQVMEFLLES